MTGNGLFYPHKVAIAHFLIVTVISCVVFLVFVKGVEQKWIIVLSSCLVGLISTGVFLYFALDGLLQARITEHKVNADIAVILGFGYEEDKNGIIKAGRANVELLKWVIEGLDKKKLQIKTILVQEGIWVASDVLKQMGIIKSVSSQEEHSLKIITKNNATIRMARIHEHKGKPYVNTFNTLYLAAGRINKTKQRKVLLVAHDLQLQRSIVAWNIAAAKYEESFANIELVVPYLGKRIPGSWHSVHLWTKARVIYKFGELLIRIRESYKLLPAREMNRVRIEGQIW